MCLGGTQIKMALEAQTNSFVLDNDANKVSFKIRNHFVFGKSKRGSLCPQRFRSFIKCLFCRNMYKNKTYFILNQDALKEQTNLYNKSLFLVGSTQWAYLGERD